MSTGLVDTDPGGSLPAHQVGGPGVVPLVEAEEALEFLPAAHRVCTVLEQSYILQDCPSSPPLCGSGAKSFVVP